MEMTYRTKRLELKILDDTASAKVLQFYLDNREVIEKYETERPSQFYTEEFQKMLLQGEYNLAVKQKSFRFWVEGERNDSSMCSSRARRKSRTTTSRRVRLTLGKPMR